MAPLNKSSTGGTEEVIVNCSRQRSSHKLPGPERPLDSAANKIFCAIYLLVVNVLNPFVLSHLLSCIPSETVDPGQYLW